MSVETIELQLRSAKLTLLLDDLMAIAQALDKPGHTRAAITVADAVAAIRHERELLIAEGWRS